MEVKLDLEQITHLKEFVDLLTVSMHESLRANAGLMFTWVFLFLFLFFLVNFRGGTHMVEVNGR